MDKFSGNQGHPCPPSPKNDPLLLLEVHAKSIVSHIRHSLIDAMADNYGAIFSPNLESSLI
jgi:hypothetical protein